MSRRRYFEEQRSGNGAICHCVEMEIDLSSGNYVNLFDLMSKIESSTISQGDINSVLSYLREGEGTEAEEEPAAYKNCQVHHMDPEKVEMVAMVL